MERKSWTVDVDGTEHVVALDWTYYGGRRRVSLDGAVVDESTVPMRWRSEQSFFDLAGHPAVMRTRPSKRFSAYFLIELEVDGRLVESVTGRKAYWEA